MARSSPHPSGELAAELQDSNLGLSALSLCSAVPCHFLVKGI